MLAASINEKLKEYWLIIDNNTTISSILDPQNKISLFKPGEPMTNAIAALRVTAETTLPPSPSPDFAEIERYLALPCDENVKRFFGDKPTPLNFWYFH
ncbi:hypothetical protein GLOIN_2v1484476 [Rhizophagus clarus]|uniref:Uncharacterized protein n=1 Tax=Rhizophagus clarus TaxID=94130 RepID=A0A8H3LUB5_9GLOM|nr:hypothetical protein GLOIN_2v1484476 [Rhizophagus clarus]